MEAAFLSGQLGKALYAEGELLFALEPGALPRPASLGEFREVSRAGSEYELISNTSIEALRELLEDRIQKHNALFLSLGLLDVELSLSTRVVVAQAVERLLAEARVYEFVSRRLLSVPLPVESRAHRQRSMGLILTFENAKSLLDEVFDAQPALDELWGAWRETLDEYAIDESARPALAAYFVDGGFFSESIRAIRGHDLLRFNSVVVQHSLLPQASTVLKSARSFLTTFRSKVQSRIFVKSEKATQRRLALRKSAPLPRSVAHEDRDKAADDAVYDLGDNRKIPRRILGAFEAKTRVDKQIAAIREAIFGGKSVQAERYLQELLDFQLGQGDREHAAMSLCALTAISLEANQLDMADELSEFAVKLTSDDPVVYTTRAEVFRQRGHFHAALKAYDEAVQRFPRELYALDGRAEVKKEMGQFDESMKMYQEIQKLFPDDSVAFNGEVGVLRAMGDLRRALKLSVSYAKRFELDAVSRATLASCLASLGKYQDALRHYQAAISLDYSNVRVVLGYIFTLKSSGNLTAALEYASTALSRFPDTPSLVNAKAILLRGAYRLDEALDVHERLAKRFPSYTPAKFGAAAVRILRNEPDEAVRLLSEKTPESELDWFGFRILALSHLRMQNYEEAISRLEVGSEKCPWLKERVKFETTLGVAELQRKNSTRAVELFHKSLDRLEDREKQVRFVFLAHAQAESGSVDIAKVILGSLFAGRDPELITLRRAINDNYHLGLRLDTTAIVSTLSLPTIIARSELSLSMAA